MKYLIFIDESGSINCYGKECFSLSLSIIKREDFSKTKNYFKRKFLEIKSKNDMPIKSELKAHNLKLIGDFESILKIYISFCKRNEFICAFLINNKDENRKFLTDKNATYNFMVKSALERAIDKEYIQKGSELEIVADKREISTKYLMSIETYLRSHFILEKNEIKTLTFSFVESHLHWGVQLADIISFCNFQKINNSGKLDARFRKIF